MYNVIRLSEGFFCGAYCKKQKNTKNKKLIKDRGWGHLLNKNKNKNKVKVYKKPFFLILPHLSLNRFTSGYNLNF